MKVGLLKAFGLFHLCLAQAFSPKADQPLAEACVVFLYGNLEASGDGCSNILYLVIPQPRATFCSQKVAKNLRGKMAGPMSK